MDEIIEMLILIIMFLLTLLSVNYKIKEDIKEYRSLLDVLDFISEVNYLSCKDTGKFYEIKNFEKNYIYIDFENGKIFCGNPLREVQKIEDCNLTCKLIFLPEIVNRSYGMMLRCAK